jgi:hypothetical protein
MSTRNARRRQFVSVGIILCIGFVAISPTAGQLLCGQRYIYWDFVMSDGFISDVDYPDTPCRKLTTTNSADGDKAGLVEYYFDAYYGTATNPQCSSGTTARAANGFTRSGATVSASWRDCLDNT